MKSENELNQDIIAITAKITQEYPELVKFINEIPLNNSQPSNSPNLKGLEEYYNSLVEIVKDYSKTHEPMQEKPTNLPGYEYYVATDDIYSQDKEEKDIDPENSSQDKAPNKKGHSMNEKSFNEDMSGDDLDVPGSELDDEQEGNGSEDEENNYYSLGGDNHHDLDESKD